MPRTLAPVRSLITAAGETAQLSMAETVGGTGLGLGDELTVGVMHALAHSDDAVAFLTVNTLHRLHELFHVKIRLRQVDEVGRAAGKSGERGAGSEPAGMAAHDLYDADHTGIVDVGVLVDLGAAGGDILGGAGKSGAVVGVVEVVVYGLGYAHNAALPAGPGHIAADFVAGVHGIIAAVIEEVAYIVLLEDIEDALIVSVAIL